MEQGRFYSLDQINYPAQYYTQEELEQLLGVNQPDFKPSSIPGLALPLHEISDTASENAYAHFRPLVMQSLQTIEWKEQVGRQDQVALSHPFAFLSHLFGKGQ